MSLTLEQVVPWGRSLAEYERMFALTPADLRGTILDCAGGPASFNAELTRRGSQVVSCDPLYQFSADEIARRIEEIYPTMIARAEANRDAYVWTVIASPEQMGQVRLDSMRTFLADFPAGQTAGRYVTASLPNLPFGEGEFSLALCSHLLFTYSEQLPLSFHLDAIEELCRVAREVRVFPLLDMDGQPSLLLDPVVGELERRGYVVEVRRVMYEFQRGGNRLLSISRA